MLERNHDPLEVVIDMRPHRLKREWVRVARVEGTQLRFSMQKQAVSVDYDDTMVVAQADPHAIDELRRRLYKQTPSIETLVSEIMSSPVLSIRPDQSVTECMALMTSRYLRHLPVVSDGVLIGLVSIGDLVKASLDEKDFLIQQLESYITGG